jgi:hypothetical protein
MGKAIVEVSKFIVNNISLVKAMVGVIITLKVGWMVTNGVVALYTAGVISATTATKALRTALITTGIGAVIVGLGFLAEGWLNAADAQDQYDPNLPLPDNGIPPVFTGTDPGAYSRLYEERRQARIREINATADAIKKALKAKIDEIRKTAESFRDSVGLAFGTFGKDENSVFNVDVVIAKLKRVVDAAKGFAQNINKLRKAGATSDVIAEITSMGPAQGNIVAKGLLQSGKLSEYLGLRKSLYNTGASVGAEGAITGDATYNIKVEGTALKASDIIAEIRKYEKANGRKYLLNG